MTPEVSLTRIFYGAAVTLGLLRWRGEMVYTVEDAWADNRRMESCIPDGTYRVVPRRFNRGGYDAWEITGVPGRTTILIHRGNRAADVTGCVIVGTELGVLAGDLAVLQSAAAFAQLARDFAGREFTLDIRPEPPLRGTPLKVAESV